MSDLTRLDSFAADIRTRVVPPDFTTLCAVSRRRRRTAVIASAAAAAAVIAVAGIGARSVYGDQSAPIPPAHTGATTGPTTSAPSGVLTAEQIVHDPTSNLLNFEIAPDDQNVRATGWRVCIHARCAQAVAVTRDGFAHASYVKVQDAYGVTWVGGDEFAVDHGDGNAALVNPDGDETPLHLTTQPGPLRSDETVVLLGIGTRSARYYGVSPAKAVAHPISLPAYLEVTSLNDQAGTLVAFAGGHTIITSSDRGTTWRVPTALPKLWLYGTVPSGDPSVLAVMNVGDTATLVPGTVRRSLDGGVTWQVIRSPQMQQVVANWSAITPEGHLLVNIPRRGFQGPTGLWESDSTWMHFHRIADASPHPSTFLGGFDVLPVTSSNGVQSLYVVDELAFVSTDGGRTWHRTAVR
jgi:BNR/Asp-box repeat protein